VVYDNIELIKPENSAQLIADLKNRTGLPVTRTRLDKIDLLRDVAFLYVYYYDDQNQGDGAVNDDGDDDD
jgi:hypothetical protein